MSPKLRRIWIQMTADRKRFGILCAVVALGLLLWGRLIVVSNLPRTAVAEPPVSDGARSTGKSGRPGSANSEKARPTMAITLSSTPQRDPFVISPKYFPRPTPATSQPSDAGKLVVKPTEDGLQAEARYTAQLRSLAAKFKLEAAMGGSIAVINGRTYRSGDVVPSVTDERVGFTLVEIKQRSVVLECDGRVFELQMATPGQ